MKRNNKKRTKTTYQATSEGPVPSGATDYLPHAGSATSYFTNATGALDRMQATGATDQIANLA